jgi:spore germination protein YaaH
MAIAGRATADRVGAGFSLLADDLRSALHALDKQCVITVMPRTTDSEVYWRTRFATWVYDYAAIGGVADRMRIMGYHMHGPNEAAGPISTPAWYQRIASYAVGQAPASKIELALPAYGFDWVVGQTGSGVSRTWKAAEALRRAKGSARRYNQTWQEPYFHYWSGGVRHIVIYENARGVPARTAVIQRYGLAGPGLWALNFEDPKTWAALAAPS